MFAKLVRLALSAVGAGTAIYLTSSYFVRPEGVSKEVAGPLRFIPGSSGPGVDDFFYGLASIGGAMAGNALGHALMGRK